MKEGDRQTSDCISENQIGSATILQTGRAGFTSAPYPLMEGNTKNSIDIFLWKSIEDGEEYAVNHNLQSS